MPGKRAGVLGKRGRGGGRQVRGFKMLGKRWRLVESARKNENIIGKRF